MNKLSYIELIAKGEPFRLLFPLGTLLAICGTLIWPLFALGWLTAYPAAAHSGIIIQCFLTAFVIGFLGTALPRLLDVRRIGLGPSVFFSALLIVLCGLHLGGWQTAAHGIHATTLLSFIALLISRARQRNDLPPPAFTLVAGGLLCGLIGSILMAIDGFRAADGGLPEWLFALARLLGWQGFLLLPIMGIGAFLLPRFFGLENRQSFPEMMLPSREWTLRACFAMLCGLTVIVGFLSEALGYSRIGYGLRAIAILFYFVREIPFHRAKDASGALALGLKLALSAIPLGYVIGAILPGYRIAVLHVVLLTGFGLLTFIVASRVLLGHSGQSHLFRAPLKAIYTLVILTLLALALRIGADFTGQYRFALYGLSGGAWVAGIVIWAAALLPNVCRPDTED